MRKGASTYPRNRDEITQVASRSGTHVLPRPPPAPVTTTVCPLKESDMLVENSWAEPLSGEIAATDARENRTFM